MKNLIMGKVEETIVYRESDLRLYVPKYFGLQKYGNAVNKEKMEKMRP